MPRGWTNRRKVRRRRIAGSQVKWCRKWFLAHVTETKILVTGPIVVVVVVVDGVVVVVVIIVVVVVVLVLGVVIVRLGDRHHR